MKNVKALTHKSYQAYLISKLKNPNYAATYLETHLEELTPEPELLRLALLNVFEALSELHMIDEQAELHRQQLDNLLSESGYEGIFNLARWLNDLGLKLTVTAGLTATVDATKHTTNQLPDRPDPTQPNLKVAVVSEKSLELLKVHLSEYHSYLDRALAAVKVLETADPTSEEFSDALAVLHVSATVLEPYSEGMVEAIDHYTENLPEDDEVNEALLKPIAKPE